MTLCNCIDYTASHVRMIVLNCEEYAHGLRYHPIICLWYLSKTMIPSFVYGT